MNLDNIKAFIDLAKSEGVSELKYEEKDLKISVNLNAAPAIQTHIPAMTQAAPVSANNEASTGESFHEIKSPFVGTFYASSQPGKPAYVKVGDKITSGQTLCILEAMKIMNEIESDINGEIVEICVSNEDLVEYGQTIFKVRA